MRCPPALRLPNADPRLHALPPPHSGFRHDAHPMAIMVGVVGALAAFYPEVAEVR